jgi:hypothetical protein
MLRKLAAALDPTLDGAFNDWDQAIDLPLDHDASLLLTSFETADEMRFWHHLWGVTLGASRDWATDGKRCGVLTFTGVGGWPRAVNFDPDWRYGDWTAYRTFEFDARNPGREPFNLVVIAGDDESFGHGVVERRFVLPANGEQHCVLALSDPTSQHQWYQSVYYDGAVRLSEIRVLEFAAPDIKAPSELWVDNLRLKP